MVQKTPLKLSSSPVGDTAATLYLEQPTQPIYPVFWLALINHLKANVDGIIDTIPAYCSLFVDCTNAKSLKKTIAYANNFAQHFAGESDTIIKDTDKVEHEIPVCYHASFAPDLPAIAKARHLTCEQVIEYHTAQTYQVYALGFIPGFAFLGYVDDHIATPRRNSPRAEVAAGSVGIAGRQTGIYPAQSPGGWQIIGRTPITLYAPDKKIYSLFDIASRVRFYAITLEQFQHWNDS